VILAVFAVLVVLFVILPIVGVALWWIISTAIVGLIVGALGRLIVPGRNPIGFLATIGCGLVGALIGGAIGHAIGGRFVTILIEVGVAAGAVAVWSASHRTAIGGRRSAIGRGRF
jgi:uncharacterized membrane protein YeaQ/YmgE (transglycosylase-associated protein family)